MIDFPTLSDGQGGCNCCFVVLSACFDGCSAPPGPLGGLADFASKVIVSSISASSSESSTNSADLIFRGGALVSFLGSPLIAASTSFGFAVRASFFGFFESKRFDWASFSLTLVFLKESCECERTIDGALFGASRPAPTSLSWAVPYPSTISSEAWTWILGVLLF